MMPYPQTKISNSTRAPKRVRTAPDSLLIQVMATGVKCRRKREKKALSPSHQAAEPLKTPATRKSGCRALVPSLTRPTPMNMAVKEMIVMGLVKVRKKVETKFPAREAAPEGASPSWCWSWGFLDMVFHPSQSRNTPPAILIKRLTDTKNPVSEARPKAAMAP